MSTAPLRRRGARPLPRFDPSAAPVRTKGVATRPTTIERRRQLFREAVEIIEREYASDLELADVAYRIATSRRQLQRSFAEAGATSFRDHLAAVRMRHAVELLSGGGAQVRDVALTVGYRQPAQFAKAFRRSQGMAPSGYRLRGADDARARLAEEPRRGITSESPQNARHHPVAAREAA